MKASKFVFLFFCVLSFVTLFSCNKEPDQMPDHRYGYNGGVNLTITFDSTQDRLDSIGNWSFVPPWHGSQSPTIDLLRIARIAFLSDTNEQSEYPISEEVTDMNGDGVAINGYFHYNGAATFKYLRIYFIYQNYKIHCKVNGNYGDANLFSYLCQCYIPYYDSLYIGNYFMNADSPIDAGAWYLDINSLGLDSVLLGKTTMITGPNVLYSYPYGYFPNTYSITCAINPPMIFKNDQTRSFKLAISTNHAFEWIEHSTPGIFEPLDGDTIYDFGLRGAKVIQ